MRRIWFFVPVVAIVALWAFYRFVICERRVVATCTACLVQRAFCRSDSDDEGLEGETDATINARERALTDVKFAACLDDCHRGGEECNRCMSNVSAEVKVCSSHVERQLHLPIGVH